MVASKIYKKMPTCQDSAGIFIPLSLRAALNTVQLGQKVITQGGIEGGLIDSTLPLLWLLTFLKTIAML